MKTGRITEVHRTNFTVVVNGQELLATVRGTFHNEGQFPKVGDYVEVETLEDEKAVITEIQERHSVVKRKASSEDEEQIIVANVDKIFVVMGLDDDFSLNRLERYLLLAQQSQITPVVILNKTDLAEDFENKLEQVRSISGHNQVLAVSATNGTEMDKLSETIKQNETIVLLGSSGAGKSTITNWLLNEDVQATKEVREDDGKGRHTTTSRQLFNLPNGAYLIDTPGMRELGVLDADTNDEQVVFERVDYFAGQCKFRNCDHEKSAGCAVLQALEDGELTERELNNYHKLLKEKSYQDSKVSDTAGRHYEQNQKRQNQKNEAIRRQKLSRGL